MFSVSENKLSLIAIRFQSRRLHVSVIAQVNCSVPQVTARFDNLPVLCGYRYPQSQQRHKIDNFWNKAKYFVKH